MNYKMIGKNAKHAVRVAGRYARKYGPAVATVLSTVATIGGTVWACKKTLDIQPKIAEYKAERENMEDKKELRKSYLSEAGYLAKEYAGPAMAIVTGEALKVGTVVHLERTVGELTLGIAALQTQISDMRAAMVNELGEEKTEDILRGLEESQDETCGDGLYSPNIKGLSPYAVVFDENHPWWMEDPRYRLKNFHMAQNFMNDRLVQLSTHSNLRYRKPVYMNDIYEELKYPDTELGSHAGYFFDPQNHPEVDNMIEFIFVDTETGKRITEFPDGIDRPVYVDFNVNYGYVTQFLPTN